MADLWDWAVDAIKGIDAGDVLNAGVNIGGALLANNATNEAIDTQTAAGEKALALQEKMYNQSRADLAPYRATGEAANAKLSQLMGLAPVDGTAIRSNLMKSYPALFGTGQAESPATSVTPAGYGSADEQLLERLQMYAGQTGTGGAPNANARIARRLLTEYNRVKDIPDGEVNKYTGVPFSKAEYLAGLQGQLENMAMGKNEGLFSQAEREMTPEGRAQRDKVYFSTYLPSQSKQSFIGKYGAPLVAGAITAGAGWAGAPALASNVIKGASTLSRFATGR